MNGRPGRHGVLIVLEGIDGAGKSSLARALARRWRSRGLHVQTTREPFDVRLGRAAVSRAPEDPWGAAMVFTLDRSLAADGVARRLRRPGVVLQDRSYFSTLAYQGARLSPSDRRRVERLQERVSNVPDRVVWLDLPAVEALRRVSRRGKPMARIERRRFLEGVRNGYRKLCHGPRWVRIDASRPRRELVDEVDRRLGPWVERRTRRKATRG